MLKDVRSTFNLLWIGRRLKGGNEEGVKRRRKEDDEPRDASECYCEVPPCAFHGRHLTEVKGLAQAKSQKRSGLT